MLRRARAESMGAVGEGEAPSEPLGSREVPPRLGRSLALPEPNPAL